MGIVKGLFTRKKSVSKIGFSLKNLKPNRKPVIPQPVFCFFYMMVLDKCHDWHFWDAKFFNNFLIQNYQLISKL